MRRILLASLAALLTAAPGAAQTETHSDLPAGAQVESVVSGLEHPWGLAFLPDGDLLVTEKPGRLRWVREGALVETPVTGGPDVLYSGQGGLLDIALHPDFQTNRLVYLSWSAGEPRSNTLHLGRGRFEDGALTGFEEIFAAEPIRPTDVHYGARFAFLADGTILLGIGDGFDFREEAQRPASHYGAYVHLTQDGAPASQAVEGGAPGVYTIGHRNPQAVAVDRDTGIVWSNEHGPQGGDEINILRPGANYGWPIASFGVNYTGALVTPFDHYEGMEDPVHYWVPSIAPAGMAVYRGEMFPEWDGDLLVAALIAGDADGAGHVRRVDVEGETVRGEEVFLNQRGWRVRDVRVAPDGSIYILTDNGDDAIWRLSR